MSVINKEKIRILIVDDDKSIVEFLQMGLNYEGFIVYTAFNGNDAITLAKKFEPHIVLLDVLIQGMNGYEVCSKIKKSINASIFILTARDDIDNEFHTLKTKADNYLIKPFKFSELLGLINDTI